MANKQSLIEQLINRCHHGGGTWEHCPNCKPLREIVMPKTTTTTKQTASVFAAPTAVPVLTLPPGAFKVDDDVVWTNRYQYQSASSGKFYRIAQHRTKRHWGCSCTGWSTHKKCKHLTELKLPNYEQPFEVVINGVATGTPAPVIQPTITPSAQEQPSRRRVFSEDV